MKVLTGHFSHEANTFCSKNCTFEQFSSTGYYTGKSVIDVFEGKPHYLGGVIQAASEDGVELIPTVGTSNAAPTLTKECVDRIMQDILPVCEKHKGEIDGICFPLHGAGCAEGIDDLEAYVLKELRKIVGDDVPITVALDLHGNISQESADLSNGLFGIKEYPHTDSYEAGYLAMKTLTKIMKGELNPKTVIRRLPLLVPCSVGFTANEPFVSIKKHFKEYCEKHNLIDATFFHGFPYADVPCSSATVAVVAEHGAEEAAEALAQFVWEKRNFFDPEILTPAQALDRGEQFEGDGYVLFNEVSDNPGGGAPGDATHLLREMLKRNHKKSIFGFIFDPAVAEQLHKHKVGDKVDIILGGKTEKIHGEPLDIKGAEILNLSDGQYIQTSPMGKGIAKSFGKSVRIRSGNVEIIVCSIRTQTLDDRPFLVTGADVTQYRYVGIKSSNHFRAFYQSRAATIITADPPGLQSADFSIFNYQKVLMPVFPLDRSVTL